MYKEKSIDPSDSLKVAAFQHVLYEIRMFMALPALSDDVIVSDCLTVAFLVHARVLCDFFQKTKNPRRDDIICSDYGFPQKSLEIEGDIETRFDKSLAHLTYSRLCFTDDTKVWLCHNFQPALLSRIKEFLSHVTSQCELTLLPQELAEAKTILRNLDDI